jgi:3-methyladenine DNA glycosylase/8-oxoguanine DNA glycosylase
MRSHEIPTVAVGWAVGELMESAGGAMNPSVARRELIALKGCGPWFPMVSCGSTSEEKEQDNE